MPATALGELLVYQHSQVHFAPTHPLEVSIYDPGSRRRTRLFPRPDARLHPGEATLAESAADANGDALALHVRLDAEGGDDSDLLYVYRHVSRSARGAPIEVRELALGDAAARFGPGPLQRYLARDAVGSLFRGPAERPQAD
jgi:hypothetical protein